MSVEQLDILLNHSMSLRVDGAIFCAMNPCSNRRLMFSNKQITPSKSNRKF